MPQMSRGVAGRSQTRGRCCWRGRLQSSSVPSLFLRVCLSKQVSQAAADATDSSDVPSIQALPKPSRGLGFPTHRALLGRIPGKASLSEKLTVPLICVLHSLPSPGALSCSRLSPPQPRSPHHLILPSTNRLPQRPDCFAEHPSMVLPLKPGCPRGWCCPLHSTHPFLLVTVHCMCHLCQETAECWLTYVCLVWEPSLREFHLFLCLSHPPDQGFLKDSDCVLCATSHAQHGMPWASECPCMVELGAQLQFLLSEGTAPENDRVLSRPGAGARLQGGRLCRALGSAVSQGCCLSLLCALLC